VLVFYGALVAGWQADLIFRVPQIGFIDFVYFYAASLAAREGAGAAGIYDPQHFHTYIARAISPEQPSGWYSFQYPPIVMPFLRPLSEFSLWQAYAGWVVLGMLCLMAALLAISRSYPAGSFNCAFLVLGTLASYPVWVAARNGQSVLFLAAAAVYAWLELKRGRYFSGGLGAAASLIKVQFAPTLIISGMALGRARFLAGLAAAVVPLAVSAVAIMGPDCFSAFTQAVVSAESSSDRFTHLLPRRMQNLRGELFLLTGSDSSVNLAISCAVWLLTLAGTALLWLWHYPRCQRRLPADAPLFELAAATTCLALLVFSPHAYAYDYCILVLVCPFLWVWSSASTRIFGARPGTGILRWLILCFPAASWLLAFFYIQLEQARVQILLAWGAAALGLAVEQLLMVGRLPAGSPEGTGG
jgi:hypothetical protein